MKVNLTGIISFITIICGWYYLFLIKNDILLVPLFIFEPVLIVRFLFYFLLILFVGIIILIFFEIGNEIDDITDK